MGPSTAQSSQPTYTLPERRPPTSTRGGVSANVAAPATFAGKLPGAYSQEGRSEMEQYSSVVAQAEHLHWTGRLTEAESLCLRSLRTELPCQDRLEVLQAMGRSRFDLGDVSGAIDALRAALDESEDGPAEPRFRAALALFSRESQFQSPDEALPLLSRSGNSRTPPETHGL